MSEVHIIGAGLAGLAAALKLSQHGIVPHLYEATSQAGGRCRSFLDSHLGVEIDNGNHLLISANTHTLRWIERIGAAQHWQRQSGYHIMNMKNGRQVAWWQAPDLMIRSVYNTPAKQVWRGALWPVARKILRDGMRPYMPTVPLSQALIDPALQALKAKGIMPQYGTRVKALDFPDHDSVIVATAPNVAQQLLPPDMTFPDAHGVIINGHFLCDLPQVKQGFYGCANALADWVFVKRNIVSTTSSAASAHAGKPHDALAKELWHNVQQRLALAQPMPAYRMVIEKRATFSATRQQYSKRSSAQTILNNVFLAGDYTNTRLPASIESAILSGERAAALAIAHQRATSVL